MNIKAENIDFDKHFIVDIRTSSEHRQKYLQNTLLYPIENSSDINEIKDFFSKLDTNKKDLALLCESGFRSENLNEYLNFNGIKSLNILGGIKALAVVYPEKLVIKNH